MKHFLLLTLFLTSSIHWSYAQKKQKSNKYYIGLEANLGYTFPSFNINDQERWKPTFYAAGSILATFNTRLHRDFRLAIGGGVTHYNMHNRQEGKRLIIFFTTPNILASVNYTFLRHDKHIFFTQLSGNSHLGFKDISYTTDFYHIQFSATRPYHYFLKPEIGYRRYFKHKMQGARFKNPYEIGIFYQYNFFRLGEAKVTEDDFELILTPKGEIIGIYYRILIPFGKAKFVYYNPPKKAKPNTTIIQNPRF